MKPLNDFDVKPSEISNSQLEWVYSYFTHNADFEAEEKAEENLNCDYCGDDEDVSISSPKRNDRQLLIRGKMRFDDSSIGASCSKDYHVFDKDVSLVFNPAHAFVDVCNNYIDNKLNAIDSLIFGNLLRIKPALQKVLKHKSGHMVISEEKYFEEFDLQVDEFLSNRLNPQESKDFKWLLKKDADLRERAKSMALMIKTMSQEQTMREARMVNAIKGMSENEFRRLAHVKIVPFDSYGIRARAAAKATATGISANNSPRFWPRFVKYAAAACVAGILIIGGYWYYAFQQVVALGNNLYIAYVQDISDEQYMRGTNDEDVVDRLQALFSNVKDNKDIKGTIAELEPLYVESMNEDSPYSDFCDDIAWNLAVAYLKDGNKEKPIPILESMAERNANYPEISKPALDLIGQIKAL